MAARLNPKHDQRTRDKIRTSQLVNRLEAFVFGQKDGQTKKVVEMTAQQVNAALGLLRKTLPDLQATELSGEVKHTVISDEPMAEDDWTKTYGCGVATPGGASKSTH